MFFGENLQYLSGVHGFFISMYYDKGKIESEGERRGL
jgi:hypothetical protein